jgi:uncharacterized protein (TIGR03083 family)
MTAPLDLLARAAHLMHESLAASADTPLDRPTPCTEWDLGALIRHVSASITVLTELLDGIAPHPDQSKGDAECKRLRRAIARAPGDCPGVGLTALTGAFELTVHAWDINESTGRHQPLPADLVSTLLSRAPSVLDVDRTGLFAVEHSPAPEQRSDTDRLLALFGRRSTLETSA